MLQIITEKRTTHTDRWFVCVHTHVHGMFREPLLFLNYVVFFVVVLLFFLNSH